MRYQFQSEQGDYSFNSQRFTSVIKALISINAALFLLRYFMVDQFDLLNLGLSSSPKLWQPLTYMFIHGDFFHIFMNMFVLWMFGTEMESIWEVKIPSILFGNWSWVWPSLAVFQLWQYLQHLDWGKRRYLWNTFSLWFNVSKPQGANIFFVSSKDKIFCHLFSSNSLYIIN